MTLLQTAGDAPSRRAGHESVLVNKVLIVWGGDTRKDGQADVYMDDGLYMLNLSMVMMDFLHMHANRFYSYKRMDSYYHPRQFSDRPLWSYDGARQD